MSLDEIERISENIGPLIQLSLTGGEPFIRNDLAGIASLFIKNNSVKYITVPTNAFYTERIVRFLEEIAPRHPSVYFRIAFSIEGVGEDHDRIRNAPGSFARIVESYKAVDSIRKKLGNVTLDSNTVFFAGSENTIVSSLRQITEYFDFDNYSLTYARGGIKDPELKNICLQKYVEANEFLNALARKKEKRLLYPVWRAVRDVSRDWLIRIARDNEFIAPCTAGRKLLIISETGDVFPCELLEKSMGNLRDYSYDVRKLLSQPENIKYCSHIVESRCRCTFECALAANILWGRRPYFELFKAALKNIGEAVGRK